MRKRSLVILFWCDDWVVEVDVEVDRSDAEGVVGGGEEDWEEDFFMADFAGGGAEDLDRPRIKSCDVGVVSYDCERVFGVRLGLRCGVRDRCSPIEIWCTVGTDAAASSK